MSATLLSRRRLLLAAAFVALCAAAFLLVVELSSPQPAIVNGPRLVKALAQYARDLRSRGVPIAPTVTLDALLQSGYVTPEDVIPFQGARLTFYADAQDTYPQSILVEADMPDGTVQAILADGSVQQFSKQRWADALKNRARPDGSRDGREPVYPETNRQNSPVPASH